MPRKFRVLVNALDAYQLQMQSIWGPWWCSKLYVYDYGEILPDRPDGRVIINDKWYIERLLEKYTKYINDKHKSKLIVKILPVEYVDIE